MSGNPDVARREELSLELFQSAAPKFAPLDRALVLTMVLATKSRISRLAHCGSIALSRPAIARYQRAR
jgi:hypothetical protein